MCTTLFYMTRLKSSDTFAGMEHLEAIVYHNLLVVLLLSNFVCPLLTHHDPLVRDVLDTERWYA